MPLDYPTEPPIESYRNVLATLDDERFKVNRESYVNDLMSIAAYAVKASGGGNNKGNVGAAGIATGYKALAENPEPVAMPKHEEAVTILKEAITSAENRGDPGAPPTAPNWAALLQLALTLLWQIFGGGPAPAKPTEAEKEAAKAEAAAKKHH